MVSWGDGEESSTDLSSLGTDGPNTTYDSDYNGLADDGPRTILCKCNLVPEKFVAFEGSWTGRRFLACGGQNGETCDFVQWVDAVWPNTLAKSLSKLWEMYNEVRDGRVRDALANVEKRLNDRDEIAKLHTDLRNAQDELKVEVQQKQVILSLKAQAEQALIEARAELEEKRKIEASTSNMHKFLRMKAEKDRDKLKEEKRKLEFMIGDLFKQKEGFRGKFKKIKDIIDE
ncbi:unnamed protein product [Alopecurus aequalis]